jgi:hypothetical protein
VDAAVSGFDPSTARSAFDPSTATSAFDPSTAAPTTPLPGGIGFGSGGFGKTVTKAGKTIDNKLGTGIVYGHNHPFDSVMGVLGAPQRALQAVETGANPGKAFMDPKQGPKLTKAVKTKIGLQGQEDTGILSGSDLGHKLARGVADTGLDIVNDPLTFAPIGKAAKLAGKLVPGLEKGAKAVAEFAKETPIGQKLNPEEYLRGLTPEARASFEVGTNKSMQVVHDQKTAEDAIVKKHVAEIRAGHMPDEVAKLFHSRDKGVPTMDAWKEYFKDPRTGKLDFGKGTTPQEVIHALYSNRAPIFAGSDNVSKGLSGALGHMKDMGLLDDPGHVKPGLFTSTDPEEIRLTQERLRKVIEAKSTPEGSNPILKAVRGLTHRGNQAFLAIPIPHGGNLTSLSYNRYGLPTTVKGIVHAGRVATNTVGKGKLAGNIDELKSLAADSQYGNIFDELGLTGGKTRVGQAVAGAANKVIIPAEQFFNYAQNKFLNPLETGLRAAALDAERKAGRVGPLAARNIHAAFGTDAPNAVTEGARQLGTPFAKFHGQTAIGSGLRTLATNPGRVAVPLKADRDMNAQVNPGAKPKYHMTIPALSTARALADPTHYFASFLGPLGAAEQAFSPLEGIQKGKVSQAVLNEVLRYITLSDLGRIAAEAAMHKRGQAGENPRSDLLPLFMGGYFQRQRP